MPKIRPLSRAERIMTCSVFSRFGTGYGMAAVDIECGAADERRTVRGQKDDGFGDLGGLAGAPARKFRVQLRPAVLVAEQPLGARHDVREMSSGHCRTWIDGD